MTIYTALNLTVYHENKNLTAISGLDFSYTLFNTVSSANPQIPHCTENPIYVFSEMKLCGLILNSYIHVSVSDLYIPRIGLPIWLQQNRQADPGNI
jgi:hypothetical protein